MSLARENDAVALFAIIDHQDRIVEAAADAVEMNLVLPKVVMQVRDHDPASLQCLVAVVIEALGTQAGR